MTTAEKKKHLITILGQENDHNITISDYLLYLYLHGLKKYTEKAGNAAENLGWTIGYSAPFTAMMMPTAYVVQDMGESAHVCANDGGKLFRPLGHVIGATIGAIPTVIEALINWATRHIKPHQYITQSLEQLEAMKHKSYFEKSNVIQSMIDEYKDKTNSTSDSTTVLLKELAKNKPINEHIDSLIQYVGKQNERGLYTNNGKNMFLSICKHANQNAQEHPTQSVQDSEKSNTSTRFATEGISKRRSFFSELAETYVDINSPVNGEEENEEGTRCPRYSNRDERYATANNITPPPEYDQTTCKY